MEKEKLSLNNYVLGLREAYIISLFVSYLILIWRGKKMKNIFD